MYSKQRMFSQNFLKDKNLASKLVNLAQFGRDECIVEIGAGEGIITEQLAKTGSRVIAIELDKELVLRLRKKFKYYSSVEILDGDILQIALPACDYRVFSNIPFSITADIVNKLLYNSQSPQEAYLIMQREAAQKFSGDPVSTQFSVLAYPYFTFEILWRLQKSDFCPSPSVDTVLLKILRRTDSLVAKKDDALYSNFIRYAFSRWKRNLKIGLKDVFTYTQWKTLARDNKFMIDARPSELSGAQWVSVFEFLRYGLRVSQVNTDVLGILRKR